MCVTEICYEASTSLSGTIVEKPDTDDGPLKETHSQELPRKLYIMETSQREQ